MLIDRRALLAGTAASAVTAAFPARAQAPGDAAVPPILDRMAEALLTAYPESAANLGVDVGPLADLKSRLTDRSPEAEAGRMRDAMVRLAILRAADRRALSPQLALHLDVVEEAHRIAIDGWTRMPHGDMAFLSANGYRSTPYVVSAGNGAFVDTPDLLENKHPVASAADADAYLARIEAYAAALDAETGRLKADAAAGVRLPGFLNTIATAQLRATADAPAAGWSMVTTFGDKAAKAGLTSDWQAKAAKLSAEKITPALQRQIAAFDAIRPQASDVPGMWQLPDADNVYAWLAEAGTTTKRTPEEIHQSGLEQCRALAAEADPLLRAQGLTQGTAGERMAALGKRPDLLYANTDAGRAELLAHLNQIVAKLRPKLGNAFGKLVPGNLEIRRVPVAIQDGAPNGYAGPGSIDGKTPGYYYINLKDTGIWPRFSLPTLTFHEGIPGHIWQGEYTFDLPMIRTILSFNAYSEGWGLYAEQIGDELGYYADDPLGRIGYIQSMTFRAARLVVDTGLHHKRWTMAQAAAFFAETTGYTASQTQSELNRYCVWPGQALGYKTGHNEINRLRAAAKAKMGARFDVRAFNDTVVQAGGMPLGVLAQVVERWSAAG